MTATAASVVSCVASSNEQQSSAAISLLVAMCWSQSPFSAVMGLLDAVHVG